MPKPHPAPNASPVPSGPSSAESVERFPQSRRRRRRRDEHRASIAMNFAPMIDVTFLLLIFFLVTTTFERAEGLLASDMPRDDRGVDVALPISPIVIRLMQTGDGHDDFTFHIDHFDAAPENLAALPAFLVQIREQPGFDDETPVVIVADDGVRWDHVVNCWNAALRAGCKRVAFAEP